MKRNQPWGKGSDEHFGREHKKYKGSAARMGSTCFRKKKEASSAEYSLGYLRYG